MSISWRERNAVQYDSADGRDDLPEKNDMRILNASLHVALVLGLWTASPAPITNGLVTYRVAPSETDPAISRFNEPHYIIFDSTRAHSANLLLFLTGTGGNPGNVSDFLTVAAGQGYRV